MTVTVLVKSSMSRPNQAARSWSQKQSWLLAWPNVSQSEAERLVAKNPNRTYKVVPAASASKYL